jgi:LacI family transcriptional regulator
MQDLPRILLSVESSRGFGRDLLTGISNFTRIYNPWTISRKPPFFRYGNVDKFDFDTIKNDLDGIITRIPEEIPIIQKLGIPAIVATVLLPPGFKLDPHYPTITSNNEAIAQVAMDYFISQGFSRVAYCGFGDVSWSLQRREAFKSYAKEMGYDVLCYDPPAESSWEEEIQIIGDWLKVLPKPVAVLACSDDRGEDIIEAAKISRVRIPEEVAVLGIDDDNLICNLSNPTLSSVVLNTQKTGFQAAELLNRLINGEETMTGQRLLLQPLYVEARQSTDILAIEDPEVACALGFIRQKAREAIQVQDVVNATGISRRVLESRFRKILNRSVLQEIRSVRVKTIARMVCETNMSIKSIAISLGFTSIDHISRYFKKEKGISLHQYRQKYGQI